MRKLLLTASLVLASAATGHAQSAKYCTNNLVANSFYSNVVSNGKTAEVQYHGQFQNIDPNRRTVTATMLSLAKIGNFTVLRPFTHLELAAYQQKDITIFVVQTQNPAGTGAPTPAQVGAQIRFTCAYK